MADPFDPDAYLAATATATPAPTFDPDQYLAATTPATQDSGRSGIDIATDYGQQQGAPTIPEQRKAIEDLPPEIRNPLEAASETALSLIPKSVGEVGGLAASFVPPVQGVQDIGRGVTMLKDVLLGPDPAHTSLSDITAKDFPETQILPQAEQTEPFSKERYKAGFDTLAQLGMAAAVGRGIPTKPPTLTETLGLSEKQPEVVQAVNESLSQLGKNLPDWARQEMQRRGLDPNRPLNDIDVANPSVRDAVLSDPTLTDEQKSSVLKTGSPVPELVDPVTAPLSTETVQPVLGKQEPVAETTAAGTGEGQPRIVAAGIRDLDTGEIWTGASHSLASAEIPNIKSRNLDRGGFVTSEGDYITDQKLIDKISGKKKATAQKIFGNFISPEDVRKMAETGTKPAPVPESPVSTTGSGIQETGGAAPLSTETGGTEAQPTQSEVAPPIVSDQPHVSTIANRFTQERAKSGELGEIAPGQGYSTKDMAAQGLKMSPEQINQHVSDLMQGTGNPIEQGKAVRAEEARLSQRSIDLSRAATADPTSVNAKVAADNAFKDVTDFHNGPVARLKTIFHATGMGLQGELPVDLSTFNGLREAYLRDTGKAPPLELEPKLRQTAEKVSTAVAEDNAAKVKLGQEIDRVTKNRKLPTADEVRRRVQDRMKVEPCRV